MGENLSTWEMLALGAIVIIVIFLFVPGLKRISEDSKNAEKDWLGLLIPIGGVILFVILLINLV